MSTQITNSKRIFTFCAEQDKTLLHSKISQKGNGVHSELFSVFMERFELYKPSCTIKP